MPPAGGCTATLTVASQWPGGFVASVRVSSRYIAITSWRVTLNLPNGAVANAWSSVPTTTGTSTAFAAAPWNGAIPATSATEFGFQGTGSPSGSTVSCWGTPS